MGTEHTLYLSSSGSKNLFPENTCSKFINRLSTLIILDSNTNYEVGLVSDLYPDRYYAIIAGDDTYNIFIYTVQMNNKISKLEVKLNKNVMAGNMKKIIKIVNDNLVQYLKSVGYYDFFSFYFFKDDEVLIKWNEEEEKSEFVFKFGDNEDSGVETDVQEIYVKMNEGLAYILGFRSDTDYTIYSKTDNFGNILSSIPPSPKCGLDYICLYTDIIHPTNFGGQLVNILDCFTHDNGGNKGIHSTVYKPLNTHVIDEISMIITDQNGRKIHFTDDSTLTCLLHIRPG